MVFPISPSENRPPLRGSIALINACTAQLNAILISYNFEDGAELAWPVPAIVTSSCNRYPVIRLLKSRFIGTGWQVAIQDIGGEPNLVFRKP